MKRIAVYVYENQDGIIADYALFSIKSLLDVVEEIVVVLNGKIEDDELKKLENNRIKVVQKYNPTALFLAYRKGFLSLSQEKLKETDELIFTNNSVYGPIFSIGDILRQMSLSEADFWGITKHYQDKIKIAGFKTTTNEYIQPYFMVFKNKMFNSNEFRLYFENLRKIKNNKLVIDNLETTFTKYFSNLNFTYDTFIGDEIFENEIKNPFKFLPELCIKKYNSPYINKEIFGLDYKEIQKKVANPKIKEAFDFIKNETKYDEKLIIKDISNSYSLSAIKNSLKLNFILSDKHRESFAPNKFALLFENENEIFNILEPYIKNLYGLVDVFCINKAEKIKTDVKIKYLDNNVSYFKQIKEFSENYKHVLIFMPDKKVLNSLNKENKFEYLTHLIKCTLLNRIYTTNIIDTFQNNDYIGILTPTPFVFNRFKLSKDFVNKNDIEEFLLKTNLNLKVEEDYLNTLSGVFWIKSETIFGINDIIDFEAQTNLNIGMIVSLFAQKFGFLTGFISTIETAKENYLNLEFVFLNKNKFISELKFKIDKLIKRK